MRNVPGIACSAKRRQVAPWFARRSARANVPRERNDAPRRSVIGNRLRGDAFNLLVAPLRPPRTGMAREELQIRSWRALLNEVIELVGLARVLAFALRDDVHLSATGRERAQTTPGAEQHQFGHVAEVEAA